MCGIAGAIGAVDPGVLAALRRMHDRQLHRGPDAEGHWEHTDADGARGAAFSHRRLAIIDVSPQGRQPMLDPETGNVICFNGEIYNFARLRSDFRAAGREFRTSSDTEVLLHAYAVWGRSCVEHLRGMFAFALWDAQRREVFIARDRLGIKPVYLARAERAGGPVWLFASEVRALLASGLVERRLSSAALATYMWNGFVVGPQTIVQGVQELPAGSTLALGEDGRILETRRYWAIPVEVAPATDLAGLEAVLTETVQQHLVADVPLAVFLSGGIDSSALACLATRAGGSKVRTFNVSFDEADYDESLAARRVAEALGTDHSEVRLTEQRFQEQLQPALSSLDQPTFDGINTYFVSRAVREAGITVALSGAGGDELFGGYRSFREVPIMRRVSGLLRPLPRSLSRASARLLSRLLVSHRGEVPPQTRWGKLADAVDARGSLVDSYQVAYGMFSREFLNELASVSAPDEVPFGLPAARRAELEAHVRGHRVLPSLSALELSSFVGERLLRDTDTTSMGVSLETRVPLLDHRVVETAAALDDAVRYSPLGRKQALRATALRDLDPELFERPKSGFELPLARWIRNTAAADIDAAFSDPRSCESVGLRPAAVARLWRAYRNGTPGLYWSRIWALFVLLSWARQERAQL